MRPSLLPGSSFLVLSVLLSGCGATTSNTFSPASDALQLHGSVHGGTQPISGATIQLFAAGTNGYSTGALSLLTQPVTTDAQGSFTITGQYTCPGQNSQLYLTATGGNPGLAPGSNNPALKLMAALGPCSTYNGQYTLNPSLFIGLNEVTTAAAAYALSGFFSADATQIGTSASNLTGLNNAVNTAFNLADLSSGTARSTLTSSGATLPQAKLNAVANMISACVNSNGSGTPCSTLFSAATPSGGTAPTNTLQAALEIAQHPTNNVTALYNIASSTPPFQPTLSTAPGDWSLSVQIPLSLTNYSKNAVAIDAAGNVWIGNANNYNSPAYLLEYANNATLLSGTPGYSTNVDGFFGGIAIDPSGNVWAAIQQPGTLIKMSSSGSVLFTAPVPAPTSPTNLAIDPGGNVWVAAFGNGGSNTVFKFDPSGNNLSGSSGFGTAGLLQVAGLATDSQGNMWATEASAPDFAKFAPNGSTLLTNASLGYSDGGGTNLAVDSAGNLWLDVIIGTLSGQLYEFTPYGAAANGAAGYSYCNSITGLVCFGSTLFALDGATDAWLSSSYGMTNRGQVYGLQFSLAELSPSGTFLTGGGQGIAGAPNPSGPLQIDSSGNIWEITSGTLFEIIGAATPVATPYSLAAQQNKLASRP